MERPSLFKRFLYYENLQILCVRQSRLMSYLMSRSIYMAKIEDPRCHLYTPMSLLSPYMMSPILSPHLGMPGIHWHIVSLPLHHVWHDRCLTWVFSISGKIWPAFCQLKQRIMSVFFVDHMPKQSTVTQVDACTSQVARPYSIIQVAKHKY